MKARIATGLVLAPAVVALTMWSPGWLFAVLVLAVLLAALAEWSRLARATTPTGIAVGMAMTGAAVLLFNAPQKLPMMCLAGTLLWAWYAYDLIRGIRGIRGMKAAPQSAPDPQTETFGSLVQGGVILLLAWGALVWMRFTAGAALSVAMLVVVWSADTFAYLAGKGFGGRKLAPSLSPGKTVAGLLGGLAGASAVALAAALILNLNTAQTVIWLLASFIATLFSVVGDLFESRLKRRAGVKDSGRLLPGHGGVLDRIDGLLAAAPVFAAVWWLSG